MPQEQTARPHGSPFVRGLLLVAGSFFAAIGLVGVLIPVLPGLPFLLVAAACWARASTRFHGWLTRQSFFRDGGVSSTTKRALLGLVVVTYGLTIVLVAKTLLAKLFVAALAITAVFGVTKVPEREEDERLVPARWREVEG
jgi:uncharacterized membrane protein YbaN (DUF454 family)